MLGTKKNRIVYIVISVLALALVFFLANGKPAPAAKPIRLPPVPVVDVLKLKAGQQRVRVETQGVVQAKIQIELVAQVSGRVTAVDKQFVTGGIFAANQVLLQIEEDDYQIAISQAKAKLADTEQLLASEKGRAYQAKREWRDLGNQDANDLFLRKPQLASAEAAVAAAQANLERARLDLARTQISAPFAGRVLAKQVDLGQFVSQGSVIAEVYNTDTAEVRLPITARQRQHLSLSSAVNTPVILTARYGDQQYQWKAAIERLEGAVDSNSRQYYAVASIQNPFQNEPEPTLDFLDGTILDEVGAANSKPALAVGQFVSASIEGVLIDHSFVIPRTALRQEQQIWVLADNKLRYLDVDVIQSNGDSALVTLAPSERLASVDGVVSNHSVELATVADINGEIALVVSNLSLAINGMTIRERGQALIAADAENTQRDAAQSSSGIN